MSEAPHIIAGREAAARLTDSDVKRILLEKIGYVFDWKSSESLDGWLYNVASWGGTFGDFFGGWDSGSKTRAHFEVKLSDGRTFKYSKADIYKAHTTQVPGRALVQVTLFELAA